MFPSSGNAYGREPNDFLSSTHQASFERSRIDVRLFIFCITKNFVLLAIWCVNDKLKVRSENNRLSVFHIFDNNSI